MQSTLLLVSICDYIDRRVRGFIWGNSENKRRCHLVKWDKVTRAKDEGELGIRKSRGMNMAFMEKMSWRMIEKKKTNYGQMSSRSNMDGTMGVWTK